MPFSSLGDLPDPGIEAMSAALAGGFFTTEPPGTPHKPLQSILIFSVYSDSLVVYHFLFQFFIFFFFVSPPFLLNHTCLWISLVFLLNSATFFFFCFLFY